MAVSITVTKALYRKDRTVRRYLLPVLLIFAFLLPLNVVAQTENLCDAIVVDEAGRLGGELPQVEAAAKKLEKRGADVRVRTLKDLGGAASIEEAEAKITEQCASWQDPDKSRKNSLIVLVVVEKERKLGIYYGDDWDEQLGPDAKSIVDNVMTPRLKEGKWAQGFINGLNEIDHVIGLQAQPAKRTESRPTSATPRAVSSQSNGWLNTLGVIVGGMVGLAFVAYLISVLFRSQRTRQEKEERRQLQQQWAVTSKVEVINLADNLTKLHDYLRENQLAVIYPYVSKSTQDRLSKQFAEAAEAYDGFIRNIQVVGDSVADPARLNLSIQVYDVINKRYLNLRKQGDETEELLQAVATEAVSLERIIDDMPMFLKEAEAAILQAKGSVEQAKQQGFRFSKSEDQGDLLSEQLAKASAAKERNEYDIAYNLTEDTCTRADALYSYAISLPLQQKALLEKIHTLKKRAQAFPQRIVEEQNLLHELATIYHPDSLHAVSKNTTQAEGMVALANAGIAKAESLASLEEQNWDGAAQAIEESTAHLDEADSSLGEIHTLAEKLGKARKQALEDLPKASKKIEDIRGYITKHNPSSHRRLKAKLDELESAATAAGGQLSTSQPDFLTLALLTQGLMNDVNRVQSQARSEVEASIRETSSYGYSSGFSSSGGSSSSSSRSSSSSSSGWGDGGSSGSFGGWGGSSGGDGGASASFGGDGGASGSF